MAYHKDWKSIEAQIALLRSRGLTVSEPEKAAEYLQKIGYYRLSSYFYAMRVLSGELILLKQ